jgi:hypothetical protein
MDWIILYIKEHVFKFITVVLGLPAVGTLILLLFKHRLVNTRNVQERRRQAAEEFSNAFIETLSLIGKDCTYDVAVKSDNPKVYDILERSIKRHKAAMIRYRRYLGWFERIRFGFAWRKYYSKDKADYYLCDYESRLHPKTGKPEPEHEKHLMKLARKRINKLLKYAKVN